ncbi:unnamed protein product, partial [Meganyctiphanes norvegica]
MYVLKFITFLMAWFGTTYGLGDVHTSVASVARLVEAENLLIHSLQDYVDREEGRLQEIKKYIGSWDPVQTNYIHNPLNSYHFLRRLTQEFKSLQNNLHEDHTKAIRANLTSLRESVEVPVEADVNGAAFAIVRLQQFYPGEGKDMVQSDRQGRSINLKNSAASCLGLRRSAFNCMGLDLEEKLY